MVSLGAMLVAAIDRRWPAPPPLMSTKDMVPELWDCDAVVVAVKAAKAAPPTPAAVRATRPPVTRALRRVEAARGEGRECFMGGGPFGWGGGGCAPPARRWSAPPRLHSIG